MFVLFILSVVAACEGDVLPWVALGGPVLPCALGESCWEALGSPGEPCWEALALCSVPCALSCPVPCSLSCPVPWVALGGPGWPCALCFVQLSCCRV